MQASKVQKPAVSLVMLTVDFYALLASIPCQQCYHF